MSCHCITKENATCKYTRRLVCASEGTRLYVQTCYRALGEDRWGQDYAELEVQAVLVELLLPPRFPHSESASGSARHRTSRNSFGTGALPASLLRLPAQPNPSVCWRQAPASAAGFQLAWGRKEGTQDLLHRCPHLQHSRGPQLRQLPQVEPWRSDPSDCLSYHPCPEANEFSQKSTFTQTRRISIRTRS